jgi:hypothetical protein
MRKHTESHSGEKMPEKSRPEADSGGEKAGWRQWLLTAPLALVFAALTVVVLLEHEPWRDEAYGWLVARDNGTLRELFSQMGYVGSPALFHLILYPFAQTGFPYSTMFVIHSLLALAGLVLFLRFAPFPWYVKTLYPFGFYIFYQYNIVARVYVLVVLLLCVIAVMYRHRAEKPLLYALVILLLTNTCAHGAIFAAALSLLFFIELCWRRFQPRMYRQLGALAVMFLGFVAAALQLRPPADLGGLQGWSFTLNGRTFTVGAEMLRHAFLPGTSFDESSGHVLAIVVTVLTLISLGGKPKALALYGLSVFLVWILHTAKYEGAYWHYGMIYVVFVFAHWIGYHCPNWGFAEKNRAAKFVFSRTAISAFLAAILGIQVYGGWGIARLDCAYPYSGGKEAAAFLRANHLIDSQTLVATYASYAPVSILPYIPDMKRRFFNVETEQYWSYTLWTRQWDQNQALRPEQVLERIGREMQKGGYQKLLFITPSFAFVRDARFMKVFDLIGVFPRNGATIMPFETVFIFRPKPRQS